MHPTLEVADIFRRHGRSWPGTPTSEARRGGRRRATWRAAHAGHVSLAQLKVMSAIETCRTAALGGHVEGCESCGHTRVAYNSCRNRHCPQCQGGVSQGPRPA